MQGLTDVICTLVKGKADGLELFKNALNGYSALRRRLLVIVGCVWRGDGGGRGAEKWEDVTMVLLKQMIVQSAATTGGVSLVVHVGKILMKIIARHLSEYFEREGILPEEQRGSLPKRFTTDMIFVISRLPDLARKKRIPFYV